MFGLGIFELLIIGFVATIVLGVPIVALIAWLGNSDKK